MELCPINFWVKVSLHCSVNNVLVFAAVKGAFRKQPQIPVNTALGFFILTFCQDRKHHLDGKAFDLGKDYQRLRKLMQVQLY